MKQNLLGPILVKRFTLLTFVLLLVACAGSPSKTSAGKYRLLEDGRWEITVSVAVALPSGEEVVVLSPEKAFLAAAAQKCPNGYDIFSSEPAGLSGNSDGTKLVGKHRGTVKCR